MIFLNIIFKDGERLYEKYIKTCEEVKKLMKVNFVFEHEYKNQFLKQLCKDKGDNIYGDDFKIEIIPKNIVDNCALSVQDFDENQCLESKINISFNKDELRQFIHLLQMVEDKM